MALTRCSSFEERMMAIEEDACAIVLEAMELGMVPDWESFEKASL